MKGTWARIRNANHLLIIATRSKRTEPFDANLAVIPAEGILVVAHKNTVRLQQQLS